MKVSNMEIAPPDKVFDFLKKVHDAFQELVLEVKFEKSNPRHRNVIALYGSILELTGSCILLVEKRLIIGVPILLRAILEAYIDQVNLINDAHYGYSLEISYLKEWLKILEEAKGGKNEYLMAISEASDLDESIDKWREEKKCLERKGYKPLKIEDKFKKAQMEKEYRSIYNLLCSDSHNNIRALIERHIEIKDGDFSMVFYKAYTSEDSAIYVGTNAELLMRATAQLHDFLKSPKLDLLTEYRRELDSLRGEE